MNYRLQLSPISGVRESQIKFPFVECMEAEPGKWEDGEFLRSWLVYDSDCALNGAPRPNWNALIGIGLAITVSIGCWTGLGLAITHLWK